MVSIVWAAIAASSGLLVYLLPPVLAPLLPLDVRERIGLFYYKQSLRSFEQVAFVRRVIGGYELLPIAVDDEQKLAQVTLSSGIVSDDKTMRFSDPDGRIGRLFSKPVALVFEDVPAAIDAEVSELAYWVNQKITDEGLEHTELAEAKRDGDFSQHVETSVIDPYVSVATRLRAVDPMDALSLVCKDVDPENIETTKQLTKKRFEKYGQRVGMAETIATAIGFAFGMGGVAAMRYFNQNIMDNAGGGGGPSPPIPMGQVLPPAVDLLAGVPL